MLAACAGDVDMATCSPNKLQGVNSNPYSLELPDGFWSVTAFVQTPTGPKGAGKFLMPETGSATKDFTIDVDGTNASRRIFGQIVNQTGNPVPSSFLYVCPGETWTDWSFTCVGGTFFGAGPDGSFQGFVEPTRRYQIRPAVYGGSTTGPISGIEPLPADAPVTALDLGLMIVNAGPTRYVTGKVLDGQGGVILGPERAHQVWACPQPGPTGGSCPGRATAFANSATGEFTLGLDSTKDWAVSGVSEVIKVRSKPIRVPAVPLGSPVDTVTHEFRLAYGPMTGTVKRIGYTLPFPKDIIGVGACPIDEPGVGAGCFGIQAAFAKGDGTYTFNLPPDTYRISGFMYVDGALVIGAGAEVTVVDGVAIVDQEWSADVPSGELVGVDGNGDNIADALQDHVATVGAPINGLGRVTIEAPPDVKIVNVAPRDLSNYATLPPVPNPWGSLSFTLDLPEGHSGTVVLNLTYQDNMPDEAVFYKYDRSDGTWKIFDGFTRTSGHHATLTLQDGAVPDDFDNSPGFITDPFVLDYGVTPAEVQGFAKPVKAVNEVKTGKTVPLKWRTTLNSGQPLDDPALHQPLVAKACGSEAAGRVLGTPVSLGDGWWQVDWKPAADMRGCWNVTASVSSGASVTARFNLNR